MRYGTLPLVRETGGLKDTVIPYNEYTGEGTGFSFANYNADEMLGVIYYAMDVYYNHKDAWNKLIDNAMSMDYSWNVSADKYINMYSELTGIPAPVVEETTAKKTTRKTVKKVTKATEAPAAKAEPKTKKTAAKTAKKTETKTVKKTAAKKPEVKKETFEERLKKDAETSAKAAAEAAEPKVKKVKNPFEEK